MKPETIHSPAGWAWQHPRVRERARQSGASTKIWAGLSAGTAVGWSSSPGGWGPSPGAAGARKGSSGCGGAFQDSQSPRRAVKVFGCVFQLCHSSDPSLFPTYWHRAQHGSCREHSYKGTEYFGLSCDDEILLSFSSHYRKVTMNILCCTSWDYHVS